MQRQGRALTSQRDPLYQLTPDLRRRQRNSHVHSFLPVLEHALAEHAPSPPPGR